MTGCGLLPHYVPKEQTRGEHRQFPGADACGARYGYADAHATHGLRTTNGHNANDVSMSIQTNTTDHTGE